MKVQDAPAPVSHRTQQQSRRRPRFRPMWRPQTTNCFRVFVETTTWRGGASEWVL